MFGIQRATGDEFVVDDISHLRIMASKTVGNTTIISYAQLIQEVPIWEAGLSIVLTRIDQTHLRVISAQSTLHRFQDPGRVPQSVNVPAGRNVLAIITPDFLARSLGLAPSDAETLQLRINRPPQLFYYRYNPADRITAQAVAETDPPIDLLAGKQPTLPLPLLPDHFVVGEHYLVAEVLFRTVLQVNDSVKVAINWRTFIDTGNQTRIDGENGAALYVRPGLASCFEQLIPPAPASSISATGHVFTANPLLDDGSDAFDTPSDAASMNVLQGVAVRIDQLHATAPDQGLEGDWVKIINIADRQ